MKDPYDLGKKTVNEVVLMRMLTEAPVITAFDGTPGFTPQPVEAREDFYKELDEFKDEKNEEALTKAIMKELTQQKMFSLLYQASNIRRGFSNE